jgi:ATPase subunit of ABC transporter with duplicated ATPase domains
MRSVIDGLTAIRLLRTDGSNRLLTLDCRIGTKEFFLYLDELSEGQRVLLVLYTILHALANRATLLVFDEPDNFIADAEIQPWLADVRERVASANHGSLLVISHHPEVIDYLAADQILQLWRDSGPTRQRVLDVDRSKGLPASEWLRLEAPDA